MRWLSAGEVLCREGDDPGPMYVVCAGSVLVSRSDPDVPGALIELARLGPGSVLGELAPILNLPRSATVAAIERTQLLEVPLSELRALVQRQTPLLRVITHALRERSGLSQPELIEAAERLGIAPHERDVPPARRLAVPEHDTTAVYPKDVACPVCGSSFSALVFRTHKDQPTERTSDFHQVYRTPRNPYDYEVWVCPNDLYAALPADFDSLAERHKDAVEETVTRVVQTEWAGERPDFNVDRTLDLRERSLKLALALYRMRDTSPLRLAAALHRLAWCARERDDAATEAGFLGQALECYERGYQETDGSDPREDLRLQYLCGELSLRLGNVPKALTWFGQALRHAELKQFPKWEQMLRDRWSAARKHNSAAAATDPGVAA